MKDKLIYVLILLIAFFMVTGAMYYGASTYKNIFVLDFTPVDSGLEPAKKDSTITDVTREAETPEKPAPPDSSIAMNQTGASPADTADLKISASTITDNTDVLAEQINKLKEQVSLLSEKSVSPDSPENISQSVISVNDSVYNKWVKNSVKLYEAMDSKKAAKIIQGYNDNIARDIIYSMKKKKAAEIIAEFKPELANRIINLK
ncbi:MAG TPA: hypothetical protein PLZ15_01605 [Melioribacteraceae bacterium]|nr:hypothetical protein [Melioribacteraceae bacterium]